MENDENEKPEQTASEHSEASHTNKNDIDSSENKEPTKEDSGSCIENVTDVKVGTELQNTDNNPEKFVDF